MQGVCEILPDQVCYRNQCQIALHQVFEYEKGRWGCGIHAKNTLTLTSERLIVQKKIPGFVINDVLVLICLCLALSSEPVMIYGLQVEQ